MKVFERACYGCPFSASSIVSPERVRDIKADLERRDTHFICHKGAQGYGMVKGEVVCGGYYQALYLKKGVGQLLRIMEHMRALKPIPVPAKADMEARRTLIPWRQQGAARKRKQRNQRPPRQG